MLQAKCFTSFQVADFPDFLSGDERENAQHVVIKYKAPYTAKSKKKDKEGSLTARSNTGNLTSRSLKSLPDSSHRLSLGPAHFYTSNGSLLTGNSGVGIKNGSQTAREEKPKKSLRKHLSGSLDATVLRDLLDKRRSDDKIDLKSQNGHSHVKTISDKSVKRSSVSSIESPRRPLPKTSPRNIHTNGKIPTILEIDPDNNNSKIKDKNKNTKTTFRDGEDYIPPPLELDFSEDEDEDEEVLDAVTLCVPPVDSGRRSSTST